MEDLVVNKGDNPKKSGRPKSTFWRGKQVLVTGHTGFKGAWLSLWLSQLGANVTGISLAPATSPNLFTLANIDKLTNSHFCDIREAQGVAKLMTDVAPEIVFHMAAQALVRTGYTAPLETYETNVMGTAHVLEAIRHIKSVRVGVFITTDKVYLNLEQPDPYRETDPLGGYDPYSASKAASEIVIASYRDAFLSEKGVVIASARAGNVIGGGDWSEERLIPDAVRAWSSNKSLHIRRPGAIRPWQHVLEPLGGYLMLAASLVRDPVRFSGAWNFGPEGDTARSVKDLAEAIVSRWGSGEIEVQRSSNAPHEAGFLHLNCDKARHTLGWRTRWGFECMVAETVDWYRTVLSGEPVVRVSGDQIKRYMEMVDD